MSYSVYYSYDKSHRMTTQYTDAAAPTPEAHYFTYNERDMVTRIDDVKATGADTPRYFTYNGYGERVVVTDGGAPNYWTYDGSKLLVEKDNAGSTVRRYRHNMSRLDSIGSLLEVSEGGHDFYPSYEHTGSVTRLASPDNSGDEFLDTIYYNAWGERLAASFTQAPTGERVQGLSSLGLSRLNTTQEVYVGSFGAYLPAIARLTTGVGTYAPGPQVFTDELPFIPPPVDPVHGRSVEDEMKEEGYTGGAGIAGPRGEYWLPPPTQEEIERARHILEEAKRPGGSGTGSLPNGGGSGTTVLGGIILGTTEAAKRAVRVNPISGLVTTGVLGAYEAWKAWEEEWAESIRRRAVDWFPPRRGSDKCRVRSYGIRSGGKETPTFQSWDIVYANQVTGDTKDYLVSLPRGMTIPSVQKNKPISELVFDGVRPIPLQNNFIRWGIEAKFGYGKVARKSPTWLANDFVLQAIDQVAFGAICGFCVAWAIQDPDTYAAVSTALIGANVSLVAQIPLDGGSIDGYIGLSAFK